MRFGFESLTVVVSGLPLSAVGLSAAVGVGGAAGVGAAVPSVGSAACFDSAEDVVVDALSLDESLPPLKMPVIASPMFSSRPPPLSSVALALAEGVGVGVGSDLAAVAASAATGRRLAHGRRRLGRVVGT